MVEKNKVIEDIKKLQDGLLEYDLTTKINHSYQTNRIIEILNRLITAIENLETKE